MKAYLSIHIDAGVNTFLVNVYHYNKSGEMIKNTSGRHIVDHVYEIVLPIAEQNPNKDLYIKLGGEKYTLGDIEAAYYSSIEE